MEFIFSTRPFTLKIQMSLIFERHLAKLKELFRYISRRISLYCIKHYYNVHSKKHIHTIQWIVQYTLLGAILTNV